MKAGPRRTALVGGAARACSLASGRACRPRHGPGHRRAAGRLQERGRQHWSADRRLHPGHRQGQGRRGHPHRGPSAARRAARARRRQGGRDQGLQRRDHARCRQRASPTSTAATSTTSSASTTAPSPTTREAIKLDPTDPDVFNNRGQAYDYKGEYDLAIADYTESIRLNPKNAGAFFNRGSAYEQLGEHDRAIADYSQVHQARRQRPRGLQQPRAGLRLRRATTIWRLPTTTSRYASAGTTPASFFNRGWRMPTRTTTRRAVADFNEAIRLDPSDADAYLSRGAMHEELGNDGRRARRLSQGARDRARARGCPGGAGAPGQLRAAIAAPAATESPSNEKRPERWPRPPNSLKREREARYFLLRASMHLRVFLL